MSDEKPTFTNASKRMWTEEECRNMLNAALLYLADRQPEGVLMIPTSEMLEVVQREDGGVAMALSDDDSMLMITSHKKQ